MPKPVRNDGEKLWGRFNLPMNKKWRAAELTHILDRDKFQILNVARTKFENEPGGELGEMIDPLGTGNETRVFTTNEVKKLMKWFDEHGRRRRVARWRDKK